MAQLGEAADAQSPALADLNQSAGQLATLLRAAARVRRLEPHRHQVAGRAVRGRPPGAARVQARRSPSSTASPPRRRSSRNNLAIVLKDLDDRDRAVEKDPRSPGGKGYTGFEALLQYVYDQTMAINTFDSNGYMLKVNLFLSECSDYQSLASLKEKLQEDPAFYQRCAAILGPNQPGITQRDPTYTGAQKGAEHHLPAAKKKQEAPAKADKPTDADAQAHRRGQEARRGARGEDRGDARHRAARPPRRPRDPRPADPAARPARRPAAACQHAGAPRLPARPMKRASAAANPVLIGAVTVLVTTVAVFLAYNANQRPAVRADHHRQGARGQRRQPGQGQRGALGRHAHRRGDRHEAGPARRRLDRRRAHARARQGARRPPARLDAADPPALGARPQVRRGRRRARARRTSPTATPSRPRRPRSRPSSTRSTRCSTSRRARRRRRTCAASATRSPGAARPSAARSRSCRRSCSSLEPVMATLAEPETDLDGFVKELGDAARIVAPVSEQNAAAVHRHGRHLRGARPRRAGAQGPHRQVAAHAWTRASARSSVQRPFLTDLTAFSKDFAGATEELKGALPPLNDAVRVGTPVQRAPADAQRGDGARRWSSCASWPRRPAPTRRCAA